MFEVADDRTNFRGEAGLMLCYFSRYHYLDFIVVS